MKFKLEFNGENLKVLKAVACYVVNPKKLANSTTPKTWTQVHYDIEPSGVVTIAATNSSALAWYSFKRGVVYTSEELPAERVSGYIPVGLLASLDKNVQRIVFTITNNNDYECECFNTECGTDASAVVTGVLPRADFPDWRRVIKPFASKDQKIELEGYPVNVSTSLFEIIMKEFKVLKQKRQDWVVIHMYQPKNRPFNANGAALMRLGNIATQPNVMLMPARDETTAETTADEMFEQSCIMSDQL